MFNLVDQLPKIKKSILSKDAKLEACPGFFFIKGRFHFGGGDVEIFHKGQTRFSGIKHKISYYKYKYNLRIRKTSFGVCLRYAPHNTLFIRDRYPLCPTAGHVSVKSYLM